MSSWYRERHAGYTLGTIKTDQQPTPEPEAEAADAEDATANPLDSMTKAELLAYATESGVPPPMNNDMTKQEIRDAIDAHEGAN